MTKTSEYTDISDWPWICPMRGNRCSQVPMLVEDNEFLASLGYDPLVHIKVKCDSCGHEHYANVDTVPIALKLLEAEDRGEV